MAPSEGNLDLFVIGYDSRIYTQAGPDPNRPGQWLPQWGAIPGNHVFDHLHQRIAAVSRGAGKMELFVIGYDGRLYTQAWPDPNRPGQWQWLPEWGAIPGNHVFDHRHHRIAAGSRWVCNLDLFVIGYYTLSHPDALPVPNPPRHGQWLPQWGAIPGNHVFDHLHQRIAAVSRGA